MNKFLTVKSKIIIASWLILFPVSCSSVNNSDDKNKISISEKEFYNGKGIGPIKEILLSDSINSALAGAGEEVFQAKCITCHKLSEDRFIGPGLKGITLRRRPEWIMNQVLNPLEMGKSDSLSKELLSIYLSQMTDMNLTEADARNVLEYFRKNDMK